MDILKLQYKIIAIFSMKSIFANDYRRIPYICSSSAVQLKPNNFASFLFFEFIHLLFFSNVPVYDLERIICYNIFTIQFINNPTRFISDMFFLPKFCKYYIYYTVFVTITITKIYIYTFYIKN